MQLNFIQRVNAYAESYRLYYYAWGNPNATKVVVCTHGLNRNGRDFEQLALHLMSEDCYVVAPDLPGRGNSGYLADVRGYSLAASLADLLALCHQLALTQFSYVGTSLGGILGMLLATRPEFELQRLVLNDIGAEVELAGVMRIANYSNQQPEFAELSQAALYFQELTASDGIADKLVWQQMLLNSFQLNANGSWELKRDANLISGLLPELASGGNPNFWQIWQQLTQPVLVVHGLQSDILTLPIIQQMQQCRSVPTQVLTISEAGHAPYLYQPQHLAVLGEFLLQ